MSIDQPDKMLDNENEDETQERRIWVEKHHDIIDACRHPLDAVKLGECAIDIEYRETRRLMRTYAAAHAAYQLQRIADTLDRIAEVLNTREIE